LSKEHRSKKGGEIKMSTKWWFSYRIMTDLSNFLGGGSNIGQIMMMAGKIIAK